MIERITNARSRINCRDARTEARSERATARETVRETERRERE